MSTEMEKEIQVSGILDWWELQDFQGKKLFSLSENGAIVLNGHKNYRERPLATVAVETGDFILKSLLEKFAEVESKFTDLHKEWDENDDKLKVADKIVAFKDYLQHVNAVGDYSPITAAIEHWEQDIDAKIEANVVLKKALADKAEEIAGSGQWKEGTQAFKEIQEEWKNIGYIDKQRNEQLWNRIEAAKQKFYDLKRQHQENEEKDMLEALDLKIELAELAESLVNSEEWKKTSEKYIEIIEKWKSLGRTLPKKNEELWQRIKAAKNTFFDRKKEHFNQINQEQEANLALKEELAEKAEALKDSTDWSVTAQAYSALMDEWKKIGRVPHEKADELWQKFINAHEHFFAAKRKHTEGVKLELENNYNLKLMLLNRAEELKNSSRWGDVTVEMNKLFDEWKAIGPLPREHSKKMWEQFIGARKHFFARKDENRKQRAVYMETQKSARMQQATELVFKMKEEIALEEERLADLQNALDNVTPGKKEKELKDHLEILINDSKAKTRRLQEKLEAGQEEVEFLLEKERKEREKKESEVK